MARVVPHNMQPRECLRCLDFPQEPGISKLFSTPGLGTPVCHASDLAGGLYLVIEMPSSPLRRRKKLDLECNVCGKRYTKREHLQVSYQSHISRDSLTEENL